MANRKKRIFIFGNPVVAKDALPLTILPRLQKKFPRIEFVVADPTELLQYDEDVWILDAAEGIENVMILDDISKLDLPKRFSVHDYDLALDLKLLKKLGKLRKVKIIAVPVEIEEKKALQRVIEVLKANGFLGSALRS